MKLAIQKTGIKGAIPYHAPDSLKNLNHYMSDTQRRIELMNYLRENKTDVTTTISIQIELHQEMRAYQETGNADFKIYYCDGRYGFLAVKKTEDIFYMTSVIYYEKEIDTSSPWYIKALSKDETNWQEVCYNVQTDENNRII